MKAIIRKGFGVTAAVLALSMFGFAAEAQQKAPDPAPAAKPPAAKPPAAPAAKAPASKPAAKPKSACNAIKEEAGCKADAKCQWIGEVTTKAGQKRKAYCKVKSTPPKKKAEPASAPKPAAAAPAPKAAAPPAAPKKTQ